MEEGVSNVSEGWCALRGKSEYRSTVCQRSVTGQRSNRPERQPTNGVIECFFRNLESSHTRIWRVFTCAIDSARGDLMRLKPA